MMRRAYIYGKTAVTVAKRDQSSHDRLPLRTVSVSTSALIEYLRQKEVPSGLWCRVWGHSMMPLVRHGEEVFLSCDCRRLRVGDILLTNALEGARLHRVVDISDEYIETQGDANGMRDLPVATEAVVAKASIARSGNRLIALQPTLRHGVGAAWRYTVRLVQGYVLRARRAAGDAVHQSDAVLLSRLPRSEKAS
jgi:hypothetical protein